MDPRTDQPMTPRQRSPEQIGSDIAVTRAELARDLDALQERVSPHAVMERRRAAARGRMHRMRSRVMGTAHHARSGAGHAASDATDSVRSTAEDAVSTVEDKYEGSPLAAGLMAFGAGMIASAMVSPSRTETRTAQRVVDAAREHGVVDEAKSVGQEVGENLKEDARQSAEELQDSARQSAEHMKAEGQGSAEHVKESSQAGTTGSSTSGTPPTGR